MSIVRRVAIRHCHPGQAESETVQRITVALGRMGIAAGEFISDDAISDFDPDFVLCLSHAEGKTTTYPTYGVMMAPLSWIRDDPKQLRRVLSYDAHLTTSASVKAWLDQLVTAIDGRPSFSAYYTNSVQATASIAAMPTAIRLAYVGTNWDGQRNATLFRALSRRGDVYFHGPAESWGHVDAAARGRPIPFDGHSILETYRKMGAGLVFDRLDFRADDIPTNRIFEVTAAGAIALASDLPFIRYHYGDSVLYFDQEAPPRAQEWQIARHLRWIADNPAAAGEMVRQAHAAFNKDLALERLLPNVLAVHAQAALARRGHALVPDGESDPVLERCAAWIASQASPNRASAHPMIATRDLSETLSLSGGTPSAVIPLSFTGAETAIELFFHHSPAPLDRESAVSVILRDPEGNACGPEVELLPEELRKVGDLRRYRLAIGADVHRRRPAMVGIQAGTDFSLLGVVAHLAWHGEAVTLSSACAQGDVWIYGTGEAARILAARFAAELPNRRIAAFIDDFTVGMLDGVPVMPLATAAPAMQSDDCVILANQHWETLWPRLFGLAPRRLYRAVPGDGVQLTILPLGACAS